MGPKKYSQPVFDHIGLMTSVDQGRTWDFKGWILTSQYPCWTTLRRPDHLKGGQASKIVYQGDADFSLFANQRDSYMYIFYTQDRFNMVTREAAHSIYAARSPITAKGLPGTWKKYSDGSFSQPGNMGKESPIVPNNVAEPFVVYNTYLRKYMMTAYGQGQRFAGRPVCHVFFSDDLVHWTKPQLLAPERAELSAFYYTVCNPGDSGSPNTVGRMFTLFLANHATNVKDVSVTIEP